MSVRLRLKGVGGVGMWPWWPVATPKVLAIIEGHTKAAPNPNFSCARSVGMDAMREKSAELGLGIRESCFSGALCLTRRVEGG